MYTCQSCPTLCNPMDCNPPGSSIHGFFQARILEWVDVSFSRDLPNPRTKPTPPVSPPLHYKITGLHISKISVMP